MEKQKTMIPLILALEALHNGDAETATGILTAATKTGGRQDSLVRFEERLALFNNMVVRRAHELRLVAAAVVVTGHGRDDQEFVFTFHGSPHLVKLLQKKFAPGPLDPFKDNPPAQLRPESPEEG